MEISMYDSRQPQRGFAECNDEHVRLIRQGAMVWNSWRARNPTTRPELYKADLQNADLRGVDLTGAYMYGASCRGSKLDGAKFSSADARFVDFTGASLNQAMFSDASLTKADFSRADLSGADLRRCELHEINFTGANCNQANLGDTKCYGAQFRQVSLCGANLQGAELGTSTFVVQSSGNSVVLSSGRQRPGHLPKEELGDAVDFVVHRPPAQFEEVDLSEAKLVAANLSGIRFSRAVLQGASLIAANLTHTDFADADLARTTWGGTILGKTDFSRCRGLGNGRHAKSSSIDLDTLIISRGNIPPSFLRGCGYHPEVQERLMRAVDSSALRSITELRLPSCFISYASANADFARKLISELNDHNIDYWYDAEQMVVGGTISGQLKSAVAGRERTILVCSASALASQWVAMEIEMARAKEDNRRLANRKDWRVLFPISLDDALMKSTDPKVIALRHDRVVADFSRWKEPAAFNESFRRLLLGLRESTRE